MYIKKERGGFPVAFLPEKTFRFVYSRTPRLCLDVVVHTSERGVLLTKRAIQPYQGMWHLPGSTLGIQESIAHAAVRIAKAETGLKVKYVKTLGCLEFPRIRRLGISMHDVSIVVFCRLLGGTIKADKHTSAVEFFMKIPAPCIPHHRKFLKSRKLL
jgi:ADP-ribose pyrophosphatase YjhB (NUDIX family)